MAHCPYCGNPRARYSGSPLESILLSSRRCEGCFQRYYAPLNVGVEPEVFWAAVVILVAGGVAFYVLYPRIAG